MKENRRRCKINSTKKLKVIIDSTYILPAFGIEIIGIDNQDLLKLENLRINNKVEYYYSDICWIEIIPIVYKEYRKKKLELHDKTIEEVVKSIKETLKRIEINFKAIKIAVKLKKLGHKDMIDNLLYGAAIENNYHLLTLDEKLRNFIKNKKLKSNLIINHKELFEITNEL